MKLFLGFLLLLLFFYQGRGQVSDRMLNTIDVMGSSRMVMVPDVYKAQFLIEEEEQKVNYQTIGKVSIDSIKLQLIKNLKKYNIAEADLKMLGTSSRPLGQFPYYLLNHGYECVLKSREQGQQLVNELRFIGLKGVVVKGQYFNAALRIQDTLYGEALKDAHRVANMLGKKINKTIGEVQNIQIQDRLIPSIGRDTDGIGEIYNTYGLTKFEMDFRDKVATCSVRVAYVVK